MSAEGTCQEPFLQLPATLRQAKISLSSGAQSVIRQDPITVTEAAPKLFLARRGGTDGSNTSLRRGRSLL